MKKIAVLICVFMLVAMVLPFSASASSWRIIENDTVEMQKQAPTIDGTINSGEGWSKPAKFNEDTVGYFGLPNQMLTGSADLYFAYTDDGLYFAVEYTEVGSAYCVKMFDADGNNDHTVVYQDPNAGDYEATEGGFPSTTPDGTAVNYYVVPGENTTSAPEGVNPGAAYWVSFYDQYYADNAVIYSEGEDSGSYANDAMWDGDEFALSLDPLGIFTDHETALNNAKNETDADVKVNPILYSIAIFAGNNVKVARCASSNNAEITDQVTAAGSISGNKFIVEVLFPWSLIVDDSNALASEIGIDHNFTVDEVKADGVTHHASVTYFDRYFDEEAGYTDTCGRFIVVPEKTTVGTNGNESSGTNFGAMGLKLATVPAQDEPTDDSSDDSNSAASDDSGNSDTGNGNVTTKAGETAKPGSVTTKAQNTGNKTNGGGKGSAQTFDAGIAVAVGLLATSGIGIAYSRKRK